MNFKDLKISGVVNVWNKQTASWITPNTKVWVVRLFSEDFPNGLLFNYCYSTEESMSQNCFWVKDKMNVSIKTMPFSEYLELNLKECSGMNPFWSVGRQEFLHEYNSKMRA